MPFLNVDGAAVIYEDREKIVIGPRALAVAAGLVIAFLGVTAPGACSRAAAGPEDDTAPMAGECFLNEILRKRARIQKLRAGYGQDRYTKVFAQRRNCFAVAPQGGAGYGDNAQWRQGIHPGVRAFPAGRAQRAFRGRISLFGMAHQDKPWRYAGWRKDVIRPAVPLRMTAIVRVRNINLLV